MTLTCHEPAYPLGPRFAGPRQGLARDSAPSIPQGGPRSGGVRGWGARPPNPLAGALMADRGTELFEGRQRLFEGCLAEPRSWVQHLVIRGSQRELGLGSVSLAEAREKTRANRKLAREGGRTARRETSDAGHAELGRSRRARGAAEAGRLAQSEVRPRLDVEAEAVHLPAHRRDAGLGGAERRRRLMEDWAAYLNGQPRQACDPHGLPTRVLY